jgi:hypothetical protein
MADEPNMRFKPLTDQRACFLEVHPASFALSGLGAVNHHLAYCKCGQAWTSIWDHGISGRGQRSAVRGAGHAREALLPDRSQRCALSPCHRHASVPLLSLHLHGLAIYCSNNESIHGMFALCHGYVPQPDPAIPSLRLDDMVAAERYCQEPE